jgi:hypothetical protein
MNCTHIFRHLSRIFAQTLELLLPCCCWYPCDCSHDCCCWRFFCWHPCSCRFPIPACRLLCCCRFTVAACVLTVGMQIVSLMDMMFLASILLKDPCCCCKPCCCGWPRCCWRPYCVFHFLDTCCYWHPFFEGYALNIYVARPSLIHAGILLFSITQF